MASTIKIKDRDERGYLAVSLDDLLAVLEPGYSRHAWSILWLRAASHPRGGLNVLELERAAQQSPEGLTVSWSELRQYARAFTQVQDGLFAAARQNGLRPSRNPEQWLYARSAIVLEVEDCAYWLVTAQNDADLAVLRTRFQDVEDVPSAAPAV